MKSKRCPVCLHSFPATTDYFYSDRTGVRQDGLYNCCKPCHNRRSKAWRKRNPDKCKKIVDDYRQQASNMSRKKYADNPRAAKGRGLTRKFGISLQEYETACEKQKHRCLICEKEVRTLCVDHCHASGKIRGLLCGHCNRMLGFSRDSPDTLSRAIWYLANPPGIEIGTLKCEEKDGTLVS